MNTYIFTISLIGSGNNADEAWNDATEGFSLNPGPTPELWCIEKVEEDEDE
jgi:hypothetical protein